MRRYGVRVTLTASFITSVLLISSTLLLPASVLHSPSFPRGINVLTDTVRRSDDNAQYVPSLKPVAESHRPSSADPARYLRAYPLSPRPSEVNMSQQNIETTDTASNPQKSSEIRQPSTSPSSRKKVVEPEDGENEQRRAKIKQAMLHSWKAYEMWGYGHDEICPETESYVDWTCAGCSQTGIGLTLLDGLDTLYLLNLTTQFDEAVRWIESSLTFEKNMVVSVFETTIRALGGLLSAYELSGVPILLEKARQLGDALMYAFEDDFPLPYPLVNLLTHRHNHWGWTDKFLLAEVASLQLEFRTLSLLTGNPSYDDKVTKIMVHLRKLSLERGRQVPGALSSALVHPSGRFASNDFTLGAFGDSAFEYLLKQWVLTGDEMYRGMYVDAIRQVKRHLVQHSHVGAHAFVGVMHDGGGVSTVMEHLVCFIGGTVALATYYGLTDDLKFAEELAESCHYMYNSTNTGLAADMVTWMTGPGSAVAYNVNAPKWILRPETVETYFYLYRITGKHVYRDWAWEAFEAAERWCKHEPAGYVGVVDVNDGRQKINKMESFWLAETLKYLYLTFADHRLVNLDDWVFNTEAHPLRRRLRNATTYLSRF